ncbi:NUDIX hydrolase [Salinarimonas ramus]|uniref:NUDIX hydrolase n=1 Tax=Salinarimonas ramus TaxID=690164 RepID=A0A917V2P6_9HYPH|nr:NUDIX hydrolase [Salinarimonas ramus]GGK30199.1 NUDIX hydrolase [Salinarimonas ramus]
MTDDRYNPSRPFLAASVAVVRDGRVLLAARGKPPMRGIFTLPGGLVETGETLAEAALRELGEEVGVTAEMIGPIRPVEIIERDGSGRVTAHFVIQAHAARWREGEGVTGPEATAIRWVDGAEVESLPTTPGLPAIVRTAIAMAEAAR